MPELKGKLVRVNGDQVTFGSRNKPEWAPKTATPGVDLSQLVPGEYYAMSVEGNTLHWVKKLEPATSQAGGAYQSAPQPAAHPPPALMAQPYAAGAVPIQSLLASATGFAKSAMESGVCKTPKDAAEAGLSWARIWDKEQTPSMQADGIVPPQVEPAPAPGIDFDDEIPF